MICRRPLLLGEKWEDEVKLFQHDKGTVVNTETVMATASGVVVSNDVAENDGHTDISKRWATCFMVKRKVTTSVKIILTDSEKQFLSGIKHPNILVDVISIYSVIIGAKSCGNFFVVLTLVLGL